MDCKSDFLNDLLEFKKCQIQYVGKAETCFSLRQHNHRKLMLFQPRTIFAMKGHVFNRDASFIIIGQIRESTLSRETRKIY